jgi:hypothetical protein
MGSTSSGLVASTKEKLHQLPNRRGRRSRIHATRMKQDGLFSKELNEIC